MRSLRGKTAVVTGAASGIGKALALRLAREGMRLVLADVDARRLREVASALPGALPVRADVARMADVEALADRAWARFGSVDLLVNNAGIAEVGPLWEVPLARWRRVLGVNLWGAIHGCLAFVPRMLAQGTVGHVLNTASMAGLVTPAGSAAYSVGKHGVVALSEALAQDLALRRARIGVSVLCPGWVSTGIFDAVPGAGPGLRALVARGQSPDAVAEQAVRAVREGRLYVLTDPRMGKAVLQRAQAIAPAPARRVRAKSRPRARSR